MLNKIKSWFVLVSFVFLSVAMPIKAYAFVPAMLGWLGAAALESAGPLLTWRVGAPLLGLGIGGGIAAAAEDRYPGISKCLMVVALGKPGLCQPEGWSRNQDGSLAPPATTAPGSTTTTYQYQVHLYGAYISYATAATLEAVKASVCQRAGLTYKGGNRCMDYKYDSSYMTITGGTYNIASPTCPAGYVVSGSSCALSVPDDVQKPAGTPCQMVVTNGALGYDSKNPGCPTAPPSSVTINGTKVNVSSDGKTVVLVGPDGSSAAISLGSGTASIVQNYPMTDDEGSPITQIGKTTLDTSTAIPKVKTQSIEYSKGQGDTTVDKPVVTPPLDCTMISNCNWANAQIQQQQLELQNQQLQSQNQTKDKVTSIADAMTNTVQAPALPTAAQTAAAVDQLKAMKPDPAGYGGPITQILSHIGIPAGGGSCTLARTVTMFGRTFTINFLQPGFCETYQPVANWTVWGLVSLYAWNTLRRQHVNES